MISQERLEKLRDEVVDKRRLKSEAQLRELDWENAYDEYYARNMRFQNEYQINEANRAAGYDMLTESKIMSQFLVDLT